MGAENSNLLGGTTLSPDLDEVYRDDGRSTMC